MNLFDDGTRNDKKTASFSEPAFNFLNRSARPEFRLVRKHLEEWFQRYPSSDNESNRELDTATGKYFLMHLLDRNSSTEGSGGFSAKTQGSHPNGLFPTDRQVPILFPLIVLIGNRISIMRMALLKIKLRSGLLITLIIGNKIAPHHRSREVRLP